MGDRFLVSPTLADLAERQHGVVATRQLIASGLSTAAIDRRVRDRRLHRLHRGVYAVGHRHVTQRGGLWAAVLACGGTEAAVLSHRTAAGLWELVPTDHARVEITTTRRSASTSAIRVHRSRTLDADRDVAPFDGLSITTVARTLLDLADVLSPHQLERVCHRAEILRRLDAAALRRPRGRRTGALDRALATLAVADPGHSQRTRGALPGPDRLLPPAAAQHQRRASGLRGRRSAVLPRGGAGAPAVWLSGGRFGGSGGPGAGRLPPAHEVCPDSRRRRSARTAR